ncbi:MAG: MoaD/ThiS family protein [Anderseniella sp.]|jgi:molybdopterin converting factor small subunit
MVKVQVWGSLKPALEGADEIELEAASIREVLDQLSHQFPAMKQAITRGVSVSVDGRMYANAIMVPLRPDSEVFVLPKLVGG